MEPIRNFESVAPGDVLHHPALGFAVVEAIDGASVALRWEKPGENHPERATAGALKKGYRLCPPGGFLAQSLLDPDVLRPITMSEPAPLTSGIRPLTSSRGFTGSKLPCCDPIK